MMTYLDLLFGQTVRVAVKQLLEVLVKELEDERQLRARGDHIQQLHDALVPLLLFLVAQLTEQRDLPERGGRQALVAVLDMDDLQGHCPVQDPVVSLVDLAVRAFAELGLLIQGSEAGVLLTREAAEGVA